MSFGGSKTLVKFVQPSVDGSDTSNPDFSEKSKTSFPSHPSSIIHHPCPVCFPNQKFNSQEKDLETKEHAVYLLIESDLLRYNLLHLRYLAKL